MKRTRDRIAVSLLCIVIAIYGVVFTVASLRRHSTFHSYTLDLGIMAQVTWNTAHGRLFETSIGRATTRELVGSYLGSHVRPILIPLALLYRLWPDPSLLLVLQTAALAAGACPLFVITRRHTGSSWLSLAIACCYLAYPALGFANLYDFHPVCLSIPLLFVAYLALQTDHNVLFWVTTLLALSTKEEMVVPLGTWALILILGRRHRRTGWVLLSIVAAYAVACFGFIIPVLNEGRAYRFLALWSRLLGVPIPAGGAESVIAEGSLLAKIVFVLHLVLPLGLPLFLRFPTSAVALPTLVYLLLGQRSELHTIGWQYPAVLVPWLFLGAVEGLGWLVERCRQAPRTRLILSTAIALMLAGTVGTNLVMNPVVLLAEQGRLQRGSEHDDILRALSLIPPQASVAACGRFGPHLANRRILVPFDYPPPFRLDHVQQADYVLLDLAGAWAIVADDPRAAYADMISQVLQTNNYRVRLWTGRILLLERGLPTAHELEPIMQCVNSLTGEKPLCSP